MNRAESCNSTLFARVFGQRQLSAAKLVAVAAAMLTGCTDAAAPPQAGSGLAAPIAQAERAAAHTAGSIPSDALKPGQRLQGAITLDVGEGAIAFRSLATHVADDLGKQAAERLAGADGKAALDDANARVGGDANVRASDVQSLADAFAGKTMYSAQVRTVQIVGRQQVSIDGEASDGRRVILTFALPIGGDEVLDAVLEYRPDRQRATESFKAKSRDGSVRVVLERLQRGSADTWSIAGTFEATNLQPGILAKRLAGRSVARASGRFDVSELHVHEP